MQFDRRSLLKRKELGKKSNITFTNIEIEKDVCVPTYISQFCLLRMHRSNETPLPMTMCGTKAQFLSFIL